jgi:hypothetical protein
LRCCSNDLIAGKDEVKVARIFFVSNRVHAGKKSRFLGRHFAGFGQEEEEQRECCRRLRLILKLRNICRAPAAILPAEPGLV